MAVLNFWRRERGASQPDPAIAALLRGYSIEVMPRTAQPIADFRDLLPAGTRICIAHLDGTPIDDMVATATRLARQGFAVMPHVPARLIADRAMLADWIARYQGEAGVHQALLLAGGIARPLGTFDNSMQLLETGLFDAAGFTRLHVAGHPEGNRDIDPDGGTRNVTRALRWKQMFRQRTDAEMALVTQFCFDAAPVIAWSQALAAEGITLPLHVGIAGPARLQTLIRYAIACGVGPSLGVLQRRAMDVSRLLLPYGPDRVIADLAAHKAAHPDCPLSTVHFFPLGGITATTDWAQDNGGTPAASANAARPHQ